MKKLFSKILICVFVVLFATMLMPVTVHAETESQIIVDDLANLLSSEEESLLVERTKDRLGSKNYNILFLTYDDAEGYSTMVYSDDYMDDLFPVGTENNIGFIIDMDNREIYINTMGGAIQSLSDYEIEEGLDIGYNYVSEQEYFECLDGMATYAIPRLGGGYNADGTLSAGSKALNGLQAGFIPSALVAAAVVGFLAISHNKANKSINPNTYVGKNNYNLINKKEKYNRTYETVQKDYYKPKSSSSGGGGSSHRSSSGRSHGGGGRRF